MKQTVIIKTVWGETIKEKSMILFLAIASILIPVMAQNAMVSGGGVDILKDGIFESAGSAFQFPLEQDTNYDSVEVGDDKAVSFGMGGSFPFASTKPRPNAQNNLEIIKSQSSKGNVSPALGFAKVNLDQIKAGNRDAQASGLASAVNNIKILSNQ
ncbi:Uncharacterised protein [uncultured archaeon]|nr:Uncharacterised protein [uncultured archaeon]